jgi:hypothetical protein
MLRSIDALREHGRHHVHTTQPPQELSHERHTPARQRCALPGSETAESGGTLAAVLNPQRVVFRCVFWAPSSPSFTAYNCFSRPKSPTERALSATGLSYARWRLADTELLTLPKTYDESIGHLHRPHSVSPTSLPDLGTDARRTPHRARSCPRVHHGPAVPLALTIGTRALNGDADQRAPIGCHRPTIVVPIGMFPGQTTIIIVERFHGVG